MKKIILGFVALPMLALAQYDYVPPFIPDFNVQSTMALSGAAYAAMDDDYDDEGDTATGSATETKKAAAAKPVDLTITAGADDVDRVAGELAALYPAAGQAAAQEMYKQLFAYYEDDSDNRRTMGGALGTFLYGSYVAYHDLPLNDEAAFNRDYNSIVAHFDDAMRAHPATFAAIPAQDRKDAYVQMVMLGMQMIAGTKHYQDNGTTDAQLQAAAKRNLESILKVPADQVKVSDGRMRIR